MPESPQHKEQRTNEFSVETDQQAPVEVARLSSEDQISLLDMAAVVLRHWWIILTAMVFFATVGVTHLLLTFSPTYTANASFMPQAMSRGDASGLQAVASRLGMNVPTGGQASPALYRDLIDSRELLRPILADTFSVRTTVDGELARVDGTLLEILEVEADNPAVAQERGIEWLRDVIEASVTPGTGVVGVSVTTRWPALSQAVAARLLDRVNRFNLETMRSQAAAERQFVEERLAESREELRAAEEELQRFLQRNREFGNSPELVFQHDRLERQVSMRQQLFTSLSQSYEEARLSEVRNTPVITVLEPPVQPVERNPRGLVRRGVLSLALGAVLGVLYAFGHEYTRREHRQPSPDQHRLSRAWDDSIGDFRRFLSRIRQLVAKS